MTTELRRRGNQALVALGLIIAVLAFGLAYFLSRSTPPPAPATVLPVTGTQVVVARVAIPAGTLITPAMLAETRIKGLLPLNAYGSCQALVNALCATTAGVVPAAATAAQATRAQAVNFYAVVGITPRTVITTSLVAPNRTVQPPSFGNLDLPPGQVAMAVPLSSQEEVDGYLQPGDHIDLIVASSKPKPEVGFAFQDLAVLAIGSPVVQTPQNGQTASTAAAAPAASGGPVILALSRSQALGISELLQTGAIFNAVLRSTYDYGLGYIPSTTTATDLYSRACVTAGKVNPMVASDLQTALATQQAARAAYNAATTTLNTATVAQHQSKPSALAAAKDKVNSDVITVAQAEQTLAQAQQRVQDDTSVLYCGAAQATRQSQRTGNFAFGTSSMMQDLFGFTLPG
ncbi:MAG TPA: RcpC/CpaB family pilus assembly protein [Candidatus Micrarchaeia archaeon]|nr:RcpC/CpaB family pilus assembly protein [Candidatus Micrarchaeia archaeon]